MAFLQRDLSLVWATLDASPELVSAREGRRGRSLLEPRIIAHQLFCGGNALTCRDPATGALSWSYQLATRHDPLDHFSGDLVRKSMTQPLWAPARLGSFLYTVDRAERIHCIDPIDGRTAWILSVAQVTGRTEPKRYDPHATHWSIHGIADRHLLLQTDRLYLFSPGGHFRFRTPAQISQAAFGRKSGRFSPYLDMAWNDQTLYLLTHAGRLQSLELDRPVIRQVTLTTSGSWRAVAAGSTTVYLLGPTRLVACDARLTQLRWSRTLPLIKGVQSPLQQFGPGLLLGAQTVYVNREALFAFSRDDGQPTGKLIWPVYGTRVGLNGTYPVIAGQDVLVHIKQGKPVLYRGTR